MTRLAWLALTLVLKAAPEAAALVDTQGPSTEAPCRVVATAAQREVAVGEAFVVELRGAGPEGTTWSFPDNAGSEAVELVTTETQAQGATARRYAARAFALGEAEVPSLTATCRLADGRELEARSEPLKVRLRSLLPKDPQQQKLADIRPPVSLLPGRVFWAALTVLVLLLVAAGVALWRRWRRSSDAAGPPRAPELAPDVEAREALARLGHDGPLTRGDLRGHYIALTVIAKRYLERRLAAPVLEMTSTETVAFLRDHTHAQRCLGAMRELVGAADQVKFAQGAAFADEARRHTQAVLEVVTGLEDALRPSTGVTSETRVA